MWEYMVHMTLTVLVFVERAAGLLRALCNQSAAIHLPASGAEVKTRGTSIRLHGVVFLRTSCFSENFAQRVYLWVCFTVRMKSNFMHRLILLIVAVVCFLDGKNWLLVTFVILLRRISSTNGIMKYRTTLISTLLPIILTFNIRHYPDIQLLPPSPTPHNPPDKQAAPPTHRSMLH